MGYRERAYKYVFNVTDIDYELCYSDIDDSPPRHKIARLLFRLLICIQFRIVMYGRRGTRRKVTEESNLKPGVYWLAAHDRGQTLSWPVLYVGPAAIKRLGRNGTPE